MFADQFTICEDVVRELECIQQANARCVRMLDRVAWKLLDHGGPASMEAWKLLVGVLAVLGSRNQQLGDCIVQEIRHIPAA